MSSKDSLKIRYKTPLRFYLLLLLCVFVCIIGLSGARLLSYTPDVPSVHLEPVKQAEKSQPAATPTATPDASPLLSISKIGVKDARIIQLGLTKDGAMDAPKNNSDVGWYGGSDRPGSGKGAALVDGHAGVPGAPGVFQKLGKLAAGDTLTITDTDKTFHYVVIQLETLPADQADMRKMMQSAEPGKEGLNLITCSGDYNPASQRYDDRVLVRAVRVS